MTPRASDADSSTADFNSSPTPIFDLIAFRRRGRFNRLGVFGGAAV